MARDWEETLRTWSKPPSETEQTKCENAESMVRKAIRASSSLAGRNIEVFTQGSYRNNTNIRLNSDVDVCVRLMDVVFPDFSSSEGVTFENAGFIPTTYLYPQFKNDVGQALVDYFPQGSVTRGNKAFDIHANTYRVDADVVPAFEHRRYTGSPGLSLRYLSGTEIRPDTGRSIINWPHQHYAEGVLKNTVTATRFKSMARALKRLRNEMSEAGMTVADPIPSYLVECLVWNVPNEGFGHAAYLDDMRWILAHLINNTGTIEAPCSNWTEVSGLKWLFRTEQPWTREAAHNFAWAAWRYIGFE